MPIRRVLYLLDHAELGGGETSFLHFIEALGRRYPTLKPHVVLAREGAVCNRLRELGVSFDVLGYPLRLRRGPIPYLNPFSLWRLARIVRSFDPDILHANNFFGLLYAGPVARLLKRPLVWTCHGPFDIDTRVKQLTARHFADHVLAVSGEILEQVVRWVPRERASLDYLGIPPWEAPETTEILRNAIRVEFGVPPDAPLIGVVGRFQPIKGHQYLLEALTGMGGRHPGLRVWLIGDALPGDPIEQAHKKFIQEQAALLNAREIGLKIEFLGFRPDARRLLRALDLLVVPSEYESFSMAAAEGLEAGIPVLGPDVGGPREIIATPQCGLRFTPRDSKALANGIDALLDPRNGGRQFDPAAGPARFRALFGVEAHLERAVSIYRRLAKPD